MTPGASDRPIVNGSRKEATFSSWQVAHVLAVDIAGFPVRGPPQEVPGALPLRVDGCNRPLGGPHKELLQVIGKRASMRPMA